MNLYFTTICLYVSKYEWVCFCHSEKVKQIIVFFASALQGFETKLNKLLFYSDFLSYKKYGKVLSGYNTKL